MTAIYKGEPVTVVRPVVPGDEAFVQDGAEQVIIRLGDATECAVPVTEVTGNGVDMAVKPPEDTVSDTTEEIMVPKTEVKKRRRRKK